ncbi:MAG: hypothetical protein ACI915_000574 [Gammaproteobacteria bacterium]|jgi:hypothetical protein
MQPDARSDEAQSHKEQMKYRGDLVELGGAAEALVTLLGRKLPYDIRDP